MARIPNRKNLDRAKMAVLEYKGNPFPPLFPAKKENGLTLINQLLKGYREEKAQQLAAKAWSQEAVCRWCRLRLQRLMHFNIRQNYSIPIGGGMFLLKDLYEWLCNNNNKHYLVTDLSIVSLNTSSAGWFSVLLMANTSAALFIYVLKGSSHCFCLHCWGVRLQCWK